MNLSEDRNRPWLSALSPYVEQEIHVELKVPITLPAGRMIHAVPGVFIRLPRWNGPPFVDDLGKKAGGMVELDGEHLFAELALLRILEKDGWQGRWINTVGGRGEVWKFLTDWNDAPRAEQKSRPIHDDAPRQILARIAGFNKPRRYKGAWDVFAWRDSDFVFMQCKRTTPTNSDVLGKDQQEWFRSALYVGNEDVSEESFCFVQWDYREKPEVGNLGS